VKSNVTSTDLKKYLATSTADSGVPLKVADPAVIAALAVLVSAANE
jgi:hypothetical protein